MNVAALDAKTWSRRRWTLTIGILFLGQIFLLLNFGRRPARLPVSERFPSRIILTSAQEKKPLSEMPDPTLFALPHRQGFSGEAWLNYEPVDYRLASWTEPPRWFELSEALLPTPLAVYLPTNPPPTLLALQTPLPLNRWSVYVPAPALPEQSTLQTSGDQAQLENLPSLPSWPNNELLSNTVVRVLVLANGSVFSAALLAESGFAPADQHALQLSKHLRFGASPSDPFEQFRQITLRFKWQTVPIKTPNAPGEGPAEPAVQ